MRRQYLSQWEINSNKENTFHHINRTKYNKRKQGESVVWISYTLAQDLLYCGKYLLIKSSCITCGNHTRVFWQMLPFWILLHSFFEFIELTERKRKETFFQSHFVIIASNLNESYRRLCTSDLLQERCNSIENLP